MARLSGLEPAAPHRGAPLIEALRAAVRGDASISLADLDDRAIRWAIESGLGPLVLRAVASDREAPLSPMWPLLEGALTTARLLNALQIDAMAEILDACRTLPPPVLLKGIAVCADYYPEPHLRPMRDIDVLVPSGAVAGFEAALQRLGYRQDGRRPAAFYATHHHGAPFVHPATGVWVEVHHRLFAPASPLGTATLFAPRYLEAHTRPAVFHGRPVRRLRPELELAYGAAHWAHGLHVTGGAVALVDAAYLIRGVPQLDWERLLAWMAVSPAARAVSVFLTYLERRRLADLPPDVVRRLSDAACAAGPLALRLAHALIDRYVVDGRDFGRAMSERTFHRLWKALVLRRRLPRLFGSPAGAPGAPAPAGSAKTPGPVAARPGPEGPSPPPPSAPGEEVMPVTRTRDEPAVEVDWAPRRREGLRTRDVDGETVALDTDRQLVHQLNRTAGFIWDRCDGTRTVSEIARDLAAAFDVDLSTAAADVAATVRQLEAAGLVEAPGSTAPSSQSTERSVKQDGSRTFAA